ncbi:MAG: SDR family NAD(P)-dependent oxidoreductase [Gammaproteobacteria bacterium]|nr:SDR family NAD(P)-dependent oxidoreductase [Gammaproteobacteria bacterium]
MKLNNKVALVTGASSGIGYATAVALAALGAKLILCARRADRLQELSDKLKSDYETSVHCIELDVTQALEVKKALSALPLEFSQIDILVNNAGLAAGLDTIVDAKIEDWDQMIDTNVKGLLYVTQAIMPAMLSRKTGHIVNIGSIAGHLVYPKGSVYCATKHAVKALSRAMKLECQGTGIRVTEVDPGLVETEFSLVRFKGDAERAKKVYASITAMKPEDIADAIAYCVTRPAHVCVAEITVNATEQAVQLV